MGEDNTPSLVSVLYYIPISTSILELKFVSTFCSLLWITRAGRLAIQCPYLL